MRTSRAPDDSVSIQRTTMKLSENTIFITGGGSGSVAATRGPAPTQESGDYAGRRKNRLMEVAANPEWRGSG